MSPRRSSRARNATHSASVEVDKGRAANNSSTSSSRSSHTGGSGRHSASTATMRGGRNSKPPIGAPNGFEQDRSERLERRQARNGNGGLRGDRRIADEEDDDEEVEEVDDEEEDEDEEDGEDEVTRCICGFAEYQGPLPPIGALPERKRRGSSTATTNNRGSPGRHQSIAARDFSPEAQDLPSEDTSDGLFIQCDICKVWQHGFCVGIISKDLVPDNYYCEKCKPDLHEVVVRPHGPKSSNYLPIHPPSPTVNQILDTRPLSHKRRLTQNSTQDEIIKRIMEQSIAENSPTEKSGRKGRKRIGSDEDEEPIQEVKRRKTTDSTVADTAEDTLMAGQDVGEGIHEDEVSADDSKEEGRPKSRMSASRKNSATSIKGEKSNGRVSRLAKSKGGEMEIDDTDSRRDESEQSDDYPLAVSRGTGHSRNKSSSNIPLAVPRDSQPPNSSRNSPTDSAADTPTAMIGSAQSPPLAPPPIPAGKRGGGRPANQGKPRRRHNQYTKARELSEDALLHGTSHAYPGSPRTAALAADMIRDASSSGETNGIVEKRAKITPEKTTIVEMRKRVSSIMDFISRTQIELVQEREDRKRVLGDSSTSGSSAESLAGGSSGGTTPTLPRSVLALKAAAGVQMPMPVMPPPAIVHTAPAAESTVVMVVESTTESVIIDGAASKGSQSPAAVAPSTPTESNKSEIPHDTTAVAPANPTVPPAIAAPLLETTMTSTDMLDILSRKIVMWEKNWGNTAIGILT